ncbi:transglutaminase [Xanthomonas oryzae pv. oryzicola]|nr:transglutaminase [Xanthomonas oryzae pv. oryzicola]
MPLGERWVRVRYPATTSLQWRISAPGFGHDVRTVDGVTLLNIGATHVAAVQEEKDAPDDVDPYGLIEVSSAGRWGAVAAWAAQLYPGAFKDTQVAARMVQSLKLHSDDPQGGLLRAVAFVQGEIRYVGLDMGENSHAPHAPEVTLRNRYGDCKDKATLLIALLQLAGSRAEPVLVNSDKDHGLEKRLPSPYAFDHVVVRAHLPQGEVWVDATRDREDGPLAQRRPLPFVRGLPVIAGQDSLVEVPAPMPALPQIEVNEDIAISLHKPQRWASFTVDTIYRHGRAERVASSFDDDGAQTAGEHYLEFMQQYYTALTQVSVPSIDDADPLNMRTHEAYRLEWPANEGDALGFPLFQLGERMDALPKQARKSPLALGGPQLARQTVRVHSDPATQIEAETQVIANPWFRVSRGIAMRDGTLVIVGEWQCFTDRIPANAVARAASDMERARPAVLPSRSQAATARAATRPACAQLPAGRVNRLGGAAGGMSALVARRWAGRNPARSRCHGDADAAARRATLERLGRVRGNYAAVGVGVAPRAAVMGQGRWRHRGRGNRHAGMCFAQADLALDGQRYAAHADVAGHGRLRLALAGVPAGGRGRAQGPGGAAAHRRDRSGRHGAAGDVHFATDAERVVVVGLRSAGGGCCWRLCAYACVRRLGADGGGTGHPDRRVACPGGGGGIRLKSFGAATHASVASAGRCCVQGFAKARRAVTLPAPCCCRGAS